MKSLPIRGRGATYNPHNRFESLHFEPDTPRGPDDPGPQTRFLRDTSRSIVATNSSPDVGFDSSVNPYRGCEHGCVYCYARPGHEYLGMSAGLDFETKIVVKERAPELLRERLASKGWKPQPLAFSGVTDPYQPIERRLRITRRCLEVLVEFRNPAMMVTKSHLVTRDIDLLGALAEHRAALVLVSLTTLDAHLHRIMEPRAATPARRLDAIRLLSAAGIPVGVLTAPIIPGLNDHEIPALLEAAAEAGAIGASYVPLRLPFAVAPLFESWLEEHFPDRKDKVLNKIRGMRGGRLNDPRLMSRMRGSGVLADQIDDLFKVSRRKMGLDRPFPQLSVAAFRRPSDGGQLALWG
ncbi:MAG: PA0069 family radical SAM protein [Gemmatimonadetes bacterium]|nr:PA0069 family radical SAM protein [Gemmatimonadota bacterium]